MAAYLHGLGDRTTRQMMILPASAYTGIADPIPYPKVPATSNEARGRPLWEASELQAGKELYDKYCAPCHGTNGQGNGPSTQGTPSGGSAAFPSNVSDAYILWRTMEGVPDGVMGPYKALLSTGGLSEAGT